MAWTPTLPTEPRSDRWWHDVWIYQQEAAVADARRAERIERLRARVHEIDMKVAGAQSRDRWRRIQRRRDQREVRSHGGYRVESWGARPEVEHSAPLGRILSVR
jgi:hypothetical protein